MFKIYWYNSHRNLIFSCYLEKNKKYIMWNIIIMMFGTENLLYNLLVKLTITQYAY